MEVPLPWERLYWRERPWLIRREEYALTDFRLVRIAGERSDEIALQDVAEVQRTQSAVQKVAGVSTLIVHSKRRGQAHFVVRHIRNGAHVAALLELVATDPHATLDPEAVEAALTWQ